MARKLEITTLTTAATTAPAAAPGGPCETGRTCEGVHTLSDHPAEYYVITTKVTDSAVLAAFASRVGENEQLGTVRQRIIDEVSR